MAKLKQAMNIRSAPQIDSPLIVGDAIISEFLFSFQNASIKMPKNGLIIRTGLRENSSFSTHGKEKGNESVDPKIEDKGINPRFNIATNVLSVYYNH